MNELYKMVQDRQDKIARLVDDKKAEIEALQAESEKLNDFLSLGKELFEQGDAPEPQAPREVPQPVAREAAPQPAPKEAAAKPAPEMPRILPARQPREQDQSPKLA